MFLRLIIALLGLAAFTTADEKTRDCHACVNGVCYEINKLDGDNDRFPIRKFAVDRVDNLVYFSHLQSLEIRALNLTDKTTKTIVTAEFTVSEFAVDQATKDLYYTLQNGEFYKYNLVSKQRVAVLKFDENEKPYNLFFMSNKLFATLPGDMNAPGPQLYKYLPEESEFKLFEPLQYVGFFEKPVADSQGNIYFKHLWRLLKLLAGSKSITLVSGGIPELDGIGEIKIYGADKDGVAYFVPEFGKKLFNLAPDSKEFKLVGAIDSMNINSINFDKYNNILYVDVGLRYLTATAVSCTVRAHGLVSVEIVKDKK